MKLAAVPAADGGIHGPRPEGGVGLPSGFYRTEAFQGLIISPKTSCVGDPAVKDFRGRSKTQSSNYRFAVL